MASLVAEHISVRGLQGTEYLAEQVQRRVVIHRIDVDPGRHMMQPLDQVAAIRARTRHLGAYPSATAAMP